MKLHKPTQDHCLTYVALPSHLKCIENAKPSDKN